MKSKISKFNNLRWPKFLALVFFFLLFGAYTQIFAVFTPGSTLDPSCAPGDAGCRVEDNKWDILNNSIHFDNGRVGIYNINPSVSLDVAGDIEYTGTITDVSDERLKENIVPITGALNKVLGIKGKYYNMKETPGKLETGFIAQNVQEYVPTAVSIIDPGNGYLGVSYPALMPIAFGAIQDLDLKVEALSNEMLKATTLNSLIKTFLSDAVNNLDLVFFGEIRAKKLCLDDLCITKDELQKILDHTYVVSTPTPDTNDDEEVNDDEIEDGVNNEDVNNDEIDEDNGEEVNDDSDQEDESSDLDEDDDSDKHENNGEGNGNGGEGDTNMNGNQDNSHGNSALDNNNKEKKNN